MKTYHSKARIQGSAEGVAYVLGSGHCAARDGMGFDEAMERAGEELRQLADKDCGDGVFAAHLEILEDPMLRESVETHIAEGMADAEACTAACEEICRMFADIDDEYLRARADDIRDVFGRLLRLIEGREDRSFEDMPDAAVIVADNINPSDTALMDLDRVAAFVTSKGSSTSHVCIIAAGRGIAAAVGVDACTDIRNGARVLIDSENSTIVEDPDPGTLEQFRRRALKRKSMRECFDGIKLMCNAGSVEDVERAIRAGAAGIGLFRSEFIYMAGTRLPDEEEQYSVYAAAAELCGELPLTIRTLDIGADKGLPYMTLPAEENPNLGIRGIRFCLKNPELFKTQLRAILRASARGKVKIMLPMVCLREEIVRTRTLLEECMRELDERALPYNKDIELGIMIETPAAVLEASELAELCSFFSIGTNDLSQYIMAADRGNSACSALCDYRHPAVLKAISMTVEAAHQHGIECGMCGEMASDSSQASLLKSLGLDYLSVNRLD